MKYAKTKIKTAVLLTEYIGRALFQNLRQQEEKKEDHSVRATGCRGEHLMAITYQQKEQYNSHIVLFKKITKLYRQTILFDTMICLEDELNGELSANMKNSILKLYFKFNSNSTTYNYSFNILVLIVQILQLFLTEKKTNM